MKPLLVAIQFLTWLPVTTNSVATRQELGASACFYPLVGLLIGLLLVVLHAFLGDIEPALVAVVLLVLLTLLTGGLHLDGLADTADAWVGGHGSHERTLRIMKDPACGPAGVTALVLVLLAKFGAFSVLVEEQAWLALLIVPALGRAALLLLLISTPYVRTQGLGADLAQAIPRTSAFWSLGLTSGLVVLLGGAEGVVLLLVVGVLLWILRRSFLQRIAGVTGDTLGAACELVETVSLLTLAFGLSVS